MLPRILLLSLSLVILVPMLSYAQDTIPSWPPDPKDIFAEGVEIVGAEPIADDEARVIYLFRNGKWQPYPYPDEFANLQSEYVKNLVFRSDGILLINAIEDEKQTTEVPTRHFWLLNPTNGQFARYHARCGYEPSVWDVLEGFGWSYIVDSQTQKTHLGSLPKQSG